jgi:hypothetical protein
MKWNNLSRINTNDTCRIHTALLWFYNVEKTTQKLSKKKIYDKSAKLLTNDYL